MTGEDLSPMTVCLLASLVWAPVVYFVAGRFSRGRSLAAAELLWIVALAVAVLPTFAAPALSAASLSLRPATIVVLDETPFAAAEAAPANDAGNPPGAYPAVSAAAAPSFDASRTISLDTIISAAGLVYLYGVLLALGIYAFRAATFAREISRGAPIDHPELERELNAWARRLGVAGGVRLVRSGAVATVCVSGMFKPRIVVPEGAGARFTFADLVMMGAHELAHIRRGDQALFFAAAIARALFWFNPFVKRIAARAELAAEESADALVLENGVDRRRYAACFLEGLKFAADSRECARIALPSFTPVDRRGRRDRLDAILSGKPTKARISAVAAIAAFAFAAVAQAALAVEPEPKLKTRGPAILISARAGEPVRAPDDGIVIAATDVYRGRPELGKVVVIKHDDGRTTRYAQLESYSVKKGDRVHRGDEVGVAGKSTVVTPPSTKDSSLEIAKRAAPVVAPAPAVAARPATSAKPAIAPAAPSPRTPADPASSASPASPASPAAPASPASPAAPAEPAEPADIDAALAGGSRGDSNLRVFVRTDVRIKSAGGRFECSGEGAACRFDVPNNSRLVLLASGRDGAALRWSGCAPSDNGASCAVTVGETPVDVVVADEGSVHATSMSAGASGPSNFTSLAMNAPEGRTYFFRSENGKAKWGVRTKDGKIEWSDGAGMSPAERARFETEMAQARKDWDKARAGHARAMDEMHLAFNDFDFKIDGEAFEKLRAKAAAEASALARHMKGEFGSMKLSDAEVAQLRKTAEKNAEAFKRDWSQAWSWNKSCEDGCDDEAARESERAAAQSERQAELAQAQAEREQERVERERERVEREAELAQMQAEREQERAEAQAEREREQAEALAEAQTEREEARAEAESERQQLEEEIRERADALAEAERDLENERAEIERLKHELEAARSRSDSI